MIVEKGGSAQILEKLMSSYGVNTQKGLAAALDIPANNISGWTQRDRIPGNAIIKCALDTEADLQWLVSGEVANESFKAFKKMHSGSQLYSKLMENGGKPVLRRILDAYGFTTQKQLCDYLNISSGTVSTWVRRSYFPGDVVITCALDTGVSLQWLSTGIKECGSKTDNFLTKNITIPHKEIYIGKIVNKGEWCIDLSFRSHPFKKPVFITKGMAAWIVDEGIHEISNGRWLLGIDDNFDVYDIGLLPGHKISVSGHLNDFVCKRDEVVSAGKVILTLDFNA